MQPQRRSYLISLTNKDRQQRTRMRNALWRLHASEVLPGLYLAYLTDEEHRRLSQRCGVRIRAR